MRDRILEFIESENITAAEFADKIGVQRSSVSHVLNGRNNPGFAFIQKILEAFPTINSRWLLTGSGQMHESGGEKKVAQNNVGNLFSTSNTVGQNMPKKEPVKHEAPQITDKQENYEQPPVVHSQPKNEKEVSRVLIFYSDHTFEDFRPAK